MDTQKNKTKERFELSYMHQEYGVDHGRIMFDGVELMDFWMNLATGERAIKYADSEEIIGSRIGQPLPETPLEQKSPKQILAEKYIKSIGNLPGGIFKGMVFDPVYFCVEVFAAYGDANHIARLILDSLKPNEMAFWHLSGAAGVQIMYFDKDDISGISEYEIEPEWYAIYNFDSFDEVHDQVFDILSEPLQPTRARRFILQDKMISSEAKTTGRPDMLPALINAFNGIEAIKAASMA